ncbi:hypothetical protein GJ496_004360 [Pomphorhynchus laevis]|nr:hypothetical protein GJ496_004360 [Pomphorhynchus laevis]
MKISLYIVTRISCILTIYIKMINSDLLHRFGLLSQSIDINYDCGLPNPIISTIRFQNLTIYVSKMLVLLRYRGKISVEGHTMKINNLDESLVGQYTILFVSTGDNGSAVEITASVSAIQDLTIQYTNSLHQDSRLSPNRPTCTSSLLVTESTVDTMIEILKLKWDLYSSENLLIDDQVFQGMAAASTSPVRDSELKIFLMRNIVDYNFTRYDNNRKMRCALQDNYNNSLLSKEVSLIVNFYPELDQLSEETIVLQNYTGTDIIINCGISSLPVAQYTWRHIIPKSEESAEIVQKIGHERQIVFRQELPGVYNLSCTADQDSKLLTQYVVINLTSNLQSLFGREGLFSRSFYIIAGCLTVAVCLIVIIIVTTIVFLQSRGKSKNAHQSVVKSRKRHHRHRTLLLPKPNLRRSPASSAPTQQISKISLDLESHFDCHL